MQQATVNLLSDMGAQPATLPEQIWSPAVRSTRRPRPSTITAPAAGATVPGGNVTVSGTAADTRRHRRRSRGLDRRRDDLEPRDRAQRTGHTRSTPPMAQSPPRRAPSTTRPTSARRPAAPSRPRRRPALARSSRHQRRGNQESDPRAVELGVKFRSDVAGLHHRHPLLQDLRQHRRPHRASLDDRPAPSWATVTFSGESATGWQEALFASPIAIAATRPTSRRTTPRPGNYADRHLICCGRRRQPAAARPAGRGGRTERRLPIRPGRRLPDRFVRVVQLPRRCRLRQRRRAGHDAAHDHRGARPPRTRPASP